MWQPVRIVLSIELIYSHPVRRSLTVNMSPLVEKVRDAAGFVLKPLVAAVDARGGPLNAHTFCLDKS
jgi:hypothetical protein